MKNLHQKYDPTKLTQAIKAKGYSIKGFSESVLGIPYRTFKTQIDRQSIRMRDISAILEVVDGTYENLFMNYEKTESNLPDNLPT